MAEARGRGDQRRPQADGPMFGSVVLSSVLHGLVIGLMILAPHRMRSAPPTAYTVELVDPGALGGKLLAGPIGGQEARASRQKAPPPEPPPPRKPEAAPPEPPPKEPERLAQAETPPEDDAEAIPIATAAPTPVRRPTAVERPTVRPTVQPTRKPTPKSTPTTALAQKAKPSGTLAAVARAGVSTPVVSPSPKRAAGPDTGTQEPRATKATPQGAARNEVDDQLAAAIKGLETKTKSGGTGVGAPGAGGGMGGTERALTGPAGVGGEGPGGGGTLRGLEFVVYYNQMLTRIKENWAWVGERTDLRVTVRFSILPSGEITNLRLVERSGDSGYDTSVERAVKRSSPLGPPPQAYQSDFADVELAFRPADLQATPR